MISGGKKGVKISWQENRIRKDKFAEKYRIIVAQNKLQQEKGLYLHPEVYGLPPEKSINNSKIILNK